MEIRKLVQILGGWVRVLDVVRGWLKQLRMGENGKKKVSSYTRWMGPCVGCY